MSPQYEAVKQCLRLLKQSDIAAIKKLRLEIQLIQLLRLLLNEDLPETTSGCCSKDAFVGLLQEVSVLHDRGGKGDAVNNLMEHLGTIITALTDGPTIRSQRCEMSSKPLS